MLSFRSKLCIELTALSLRKRFPDLAFVTCTLKDGGVGLSVDQFADLYRSFFRTWRRSGLCPESGLRVWERHQSGGWHIHFLVPLSSCESLEKTWQKTLTSGHIFILKVQGDDVSHVAKYLCKELGKFRQKCFDDQVRQVRSWASWGVDAVHTDAVVVETEVGKLLRLFPLPLRNKSRFLLMRTLACMLFDGWKCPSTCRWFTLGRLVIGYRKSDVSKQKVRFIRGRVKEAGMHIECEVKYFSQELAGWSGIDSKKGVFIKRNHLNIALGCDDGSMFVAKMPLPDGEILSPAPLAKPLETVRVTVVRLDVVKGVGVVVIGSLAPVSPAGAVGVAKKQ